MRIVLSAPMSNRPNMGFAELDDARDRLVAAGYDVVSPADISRARGWVYEGRRVITPTSSFDYETALAVDLAEIETADGVVFLEGWQDSPGCQREHARACHLRKKIYKLTGSYLYEIGADNKVVAMQHAPGTREVPGTVVEPDQECDLRWQIDCTCDYHPEAHAEQTIRAPKSLPVDEDGNRCDLDWLDCDCDDHPENAPSAALRKFTVEGEGGRRIGRLSLTEESTVRKMVDILRDRNQHTTGGPVQETIHPDTQAFLDILEEARALHLKKQIDYGRDQAPFANVEASEDFGIPAWLGAVIRCNDKMRRLQTYAVKGTLVNEGVEDALLDGLVYFGIALALFRKEQAA